MTDKIALEQKVVDGSGKFLGACKSLQERLEAAKTLQLAKLRIDMLKYELNKVRRGRGSPPLASQQVWSLNFFPYLLFITLNIVLWP